MQMHGDTLSPWADPHQGNGCTREEDCEEEEGLPAPHVGQRTNQRGRQERQQTLKQQSTALMGGAKLRETNQHSRKPLPRL